MNLWTFLDRNGGRIGLILFLCVVVSAMCGPLVVHEWRQAPRECGK